MRQTKKTFRAEVRSLGPSEPKEPLRLSFTIELDVADPKRADKVYAAVAAFLNEVLTPEELVQLKGKMDAARVP